MAVSDYGGEFHQIFPCGADADPSEFFGSQYRCQLFLTVDRSGSPQFLRIMEQDLVIMDFQPSFFSAFSGEDQCVISCLFQPNSKISAAVGKCREIIPGRKGSKVKPCRAGSPCSGQRPCCDYNRAFFGKKLLPVRLSNPGESGQPSFFRPDIVPGPNRPRDIPSWIRRTDQFLPLSPHNRCKTTYRPSFRFSLLYCFR